MKISFHDSILRLLHELWPVPPWMRIWLSFSEMAVITILGVVGSGEACLIGGRQRVPVI